MRGRRPVGPELAEQLEGSVQARRRMRVILETLAGVRRVTEACVELEICAQRFEALRAVAIIAGIAALEPRPMGRPARASVAPEVARLEARVEELEAELLATRVRAELAGRLPSRPDRSVAKKSRPRSGRVKESRRSRPGNSPKTN